MIVHELGNLGAGPLSSPSSASVCLATKWVQKSSASAGGMFCSWLHSILSFLGWKC